MLRMLFFSCIFFNAASSVGVGGCWDIEPRTVATLALAVRRSNNLAIDLIHKISIQLLFWPLCIRAVRSEWVLCKLCILLTYSQNVRTRPSLSTWYFRTICGARNRVGIGLSYRPARLHRLSKSIPWNRFLGSLKVLKYRLR
jgi:hypothetical protein